MAPTDSGSDGENGEKPVRERLKHTTIAKTTSDGTVVHTESVDTEMPTPVPDPAEVTGETSKEAPPKRPGRKRSLEDVGSADPSHDAIEGVPNTPSSGGHLRKRYREVQEGESQETETSEQSMKEPEVEEDTGSKEKEADGLRDSVEMHTPPTESKSEADVQVMSPTKKRSRENIDSEDREQKIQATDETRARRSSEEERPELPVEDKDSSDSKSEAIENGHVVAPLDAPKPTESTSKPTPASSGFSNTSTTSPFGTLSGTKSLKPGESTKDSVPSTSKSAFASSGFASMTGSASPFGAMGATSSATSQTSSPGKTPPPATFGSIGGTLSSGFGSSKPSAFGATTSGFGSLGGGGFSSGLPGGFGGGGKLTSFAAPVGDTKLGAEAEAKPIGSPRDDSDDSGTEEADDDADEIKSTTKDEDSETKFKIQHERDTGEEGEETVFTRNAKLFLFDAEGKSWKERGYGAIKLNVPKKDTDEAKTPDGEEAESTKEENQIKRVPRLLMRTSATHKLILNASIFKAMKIDHKGKQMSFPAPTDDGTIKTHLVRLGKEPDMQTLVDNVAKLQKELGNTEEVDTKA